MKKPVIFEICVSLFLFCLSAKAQSATILKQVRVSNVTPTTTQLTLKLTQSAPYKWFFLSNPARLVIDFQQTTNQARLSGLALQNSLVKKIRAGAQSQQTLRLVFDLNQAVSLNISNMASSDHQELVKVNLASQFSQKKSVKQTNNPNLTSIVSSQKSANVKPLISLPLQPTRKLVVVIDPGHGGKDPGASGPGGLHEKDLVLAISRDLYRILALDPQVTVYMTRYGDYYIGLRQRLQLARRDKADIFIAIHADAYKDSYSAGASVFALSVRGASSEAARWLAEKENYSELGGVNLDGKNDMLRSVLIDLSQTATISSSLLLGTDVLTQIAKISVLHKNKMEQAPFVVLKSPDISSILVETGFISNPYEARALANPAYQEKMAEAIKRGVDAYVAQHPPT